MTIQRLQKFLANAGVASRRKAEELISAGRVRVNGAVVTELGCKIDDETDAIEVDGKAIGKAVSKWIAFHKPRGYVSTRDDPQGRPTIYALLPEELHSLFYVGRLDIESEGLLLLTNDGDAAHRLLHPSFEVPRVYEVVVSRQVTQDTVAKLTSGVELDDGVSRAEDVQVSPSSGPGQSKLLITLKQGKKREVRRMMSAVGHPVRRLRRLSYGPIRLGNLPAGQWRELTADELKGLKWN